MKILVIGGGGREHALVWKLSQSPEVEKVYCVPGNAGIAGLAECLDLNVSDLQGLASFAREKGIDLTVVGPEQPLVAGIVDVFEQEGLTVFGPRKEAARIEGSKVFAKSLMQKYDIRTADFAVFDNYDEAAEYVIKSEPPYVVKADGLAAGKGVVVARDSDTALQALRGCLIDKQFGKAGERVIIEECLVGEEVSVFVLTDGVELIPMTAAQDYKPVYDDNRGPNTGGMGSYSPVPVLSDHVYQEIIEKIMAPTINALASEGARYQGVLYGGLVLTQAGPKVMEFNCRFGDPETQAFLPRLDGDLAAVLLAVARGEVADAKLSWKDQACVSVVAASQGYPAGYQTGFGIQGLEEASRIPDVTVFHAGTSGGQNSIITAGGRVLNVSALGGSFGEARKKAYDAMNKISFEGMHYRTDIALKAVKLTESCRG
jgi:phosphoribosylamine--glycine ligase